MRSHTTTTIRWTFAVGILLFVVALVASSCIFFEGADVHNDLPSHDALVACYSLTSLMVSRVFSPFVAILLFLIAAAVLGTLVQRVEPKKFLRIYSRSDQFPLSFANHLQRALREGVLHSRAYISALIPSR